MLVDPRQRVGSLKSFIETHVTCLHMVDSRTRRASTGKVEIMHGTEPYAIEAAAATASVSR